MVVQKGSVPYTLFHWYLLELEVDWAPVVRIELSHRILQDESHHQRRVVVSPA